MNNIKEIIDNKRRDNKAKPIFKLIDEFNSLPDCENQSEKESDKAFELYRKIHKKVKKQGNSKLFKNAPQEYFDNLDKKIEQYKLKYPELDK